MHIKIENKEIRFRIFKMLGYTIYVYFLVGKDDFYIRIKTTKLVALHQDSLSFQIQLNSVYSVREDQDKSHIPADPNKKHIHVMKKGKEIFAINKDGSAHDGSAGKIIPREIYNILKQRYPGFNFPSDRVIKFMTTDSDLQEVSIPYLNDEELNEIICEYMEYLEEHLDNIFESIESDTE